MGFTATECTSCSSKLISITVRDNHLHYWCSNCKEKLAWPLTIPKKKIIYLDQNFFSHALKDDNHFSSLYSRLETLVEKQLIVFPFSETHVKETRSFRQNKELWQYILKLSCNQNFKFFYSIEESQIIQAFFDFMTYGNVSSQIHLIHALKPSIHNWCFPLPSYTTNSFKSVIELYNTTESIKKEKDLFCEKLQQAVKDVWNKKASFNQDFSLEVRDHIKYMSDSTKFLLSDLMHRDFSNKTEEDFLLFFKQKNFQKYHMSILRLIFGLQ